jgi:branched-chain amino acid aminotransferase
MIHRSVLHNGHIRASDEAILSPGQLGLLAGWGVFSTLRVDDGVLFAWERHWARISRDAALMNVPLPLDGGTVRSQLLQLIDANRAYDSTVRLVIVRNTGGMWEGPSTGHVSDVIALTADKNHWGESVRLTYQPEGRHSTSDFSRAKIISWAPNLRWYDRAHQQGFDECVLLNERGHVTECTSANIFIIEGNQVWTAPLASGCLPGITREVLLNEIHVPGIGIAEKILLPEDLENADGVFITSTTRDLLPVAEIGAKKLGGAEGVRLKLLEAYRRFLADYVAANHDNRCLTSIAVE